MGHGTANGAKTPTLLRELLRRQLVKLHHLVGQVKRLCEALRKQDDLRDEAIVGYHHRNRAEEGFKVVG